MNRPFPLFPSVAVLLSWALVGCGGVPYTEVGKGGGHSTVPISNDQFEITYLSNSSGGEPSTRMQELALLRAAEVTLEYGFTHFVVEDEAVDAQTKWRMKTSTRPMSTSGGGGLSGGGSIGGIGIGSPGGGMGTGAGRTGTITSSTPVPVLIPELTIKIRCHHGVPTVAFKGELYDAARLRDILAVQYNIDISDDEPAPKPQPVYRVVE